MKLDYAVISSLMGVMVMMNLMIQLINGQTMPTINGNYDNSNASYPNPTYSKPPFPGFFIFGDSLVDVGNNNYIISVAKANQLPFGVDFPSGPTGRFCNGKTVLDVIGIYRYICIYQSILLSFVYIYI